MTARGVGGSSGRCSSARSCRNCAISWTSVSVAVFRSAGPMV